MRTTRRLAEALALARPHPDARLVREKNAQGNHFLVFESDQELRRWLLLQGELDRLELHTVLPGDRPRVLHMDFELDLPPAVRDDPEQFRALRARFDDSLGAYRCAVFNTVLRARCGWRYDQEGQVIVARAERDDSYYEQTRFSAHMVWPQVLLRNALAEIRCVHAVAALARQLGATVAHDHELYRTSLDKIHSLRLAGCSKYPLRLITVLRLRGDHPHHYHDPSWVERDPEDPPMMRWMLDSSKFDPCPEELRALPPTLQGTPRPRPTLALQGFLARIVPAGRLSGDMDCGDWQAPDTVHLRPRPSLLGLPGVRGRELGWRKVAYLFLSSQHDQSFDAFYQALEQIRPRVAIDRRARREKYLLRYEQFRRFLPAWPRPYSLPALLRALDLEQSCPDALARWRFCPIGGGDCLVNFQVTESRDTGRFFIECLSCGNRRQVGARDTYMHSEYFCARYLNQYLTPAALEPEGTTLAVNSNMGTGKTTYLREQLGLRRQEWKKVAMITVRRSLAGCFKAALGPLGLVDYREIEDKDYFRFFAEDRQRWLVVQMESLYRMGQSYKRVKLPLPELDLLVLDEYLSLCKQLLSQTMNHRHRGVWEVLTALIRRAKRVVVLDADFVPEDVPYEYLREHRPALGFRVLHNLHLPVPLKTLRIVDYPVWYERARTAALAREPVSYVSASRAELVAVHRAIEEEVAQALPEESRATQLYSSDASEEIMAQVPLCNELWGDMDVVGITPSVTVGVDYVGRARLLLALASRMSCDPQTLLQMLGRFREATDVLLSLLAGAGTPKKNFKSPLTTDEVLDAANTKALEYIERVSEGTTRLDDETGVYRLDLGDWLARMTAWGVAQRWLAQHDYIGALRWSVLSHGDRCVDERQVHEQQQQRPELVRQVVESDRQERYNQRAEVLGSSEQHQERVKQALGIDNYNRVQLPGKALAFLEACRPQLFMCNTWRSLGGHLGLLNGARLLEVYAADMQAHGEWCGQDYSGNPLYNLLAAERNTHRPLPLNRFLADLVHRATLILGPFMRRARDNWVIAKDLAHPSCEYGQQEWWQEVLEPLRRPEHAQVVQALRLTESHLAHPLCSAKSLNSLLRNALSLFEMRFEVRRARVREGGKQVQHTYWRYDKEREVQVVALLDPEAPSVVGDPPLPLFLQRS